MKLIAVLLVVVAAYQVQALVELDITRANGAFAPPSIAFPPIVRKSY